MNQVVKSPILLPTYHHMIYHDIHIIFWLFFFNVTSTLLCLICYSYVISMLVLGYSHGPHGVSHHQAMDVSEDAMQDVRTTWTDDGQGCLERPGIGDILGIPQLFEDRTWLLGGLDTWTFFDFPYIGNRNSMTFHLLDMNNHPNCWSTFPNSIIFQRGRWLNHQPD